MWIAVLGLLAQSAITQIDPDQLGANPGVPSTLCIIQEKAGGDERWHWTPIAPLPAGVAPSDIERALDGWARAQGINPYVVTCLNDSRASLTRRFSEPLPRTTTAASADGAVSYQVQHQAIAPPSGWAEGQSLAGRTGAPVQPAAAAPTPPAPIAPPGARPPAPVPPDWRELNARDKAEYEAKLAAWEADNRRHAELVRANEERAAREKAAFEQEMAKWRAGVEAAKADAARKKAEFDKQQAEFMASTVDCGRGDGSRCRPATAKVGE